MYDVNKPDLIVHPKYAKQLVNDSLHLYYNVLDFETLTVNYNFRPILVTDTDAHYLDYVKLEPYFYRQLKMASGAKPHCTSYYFDCDIPIYTIEENGPRYVIWPRDEPLLVCATYVDRVELHELQLAVQRAKNWAFDITLHQSIIVFDLDETLIDRHGNILKYTHRLLEDARNMYDLVVLYSHGSDLHVDEHVCKIVDTMRPSKYSSGTAAKRVFDWIFSNNKHDPKCNKNLLSLYNNFPNTRFTTATLVDDSLYNWTPEYTHFIVPCEVTTMQHALNVLKM